MTKVIGVIITDTHLNESNYDDVERVYLFADQLASIHKATVYHGGDHFDNRKSQQLDTLLQYGNILKQMKNECIFIPGNHDKPDYYSTKSYLDLFDTNSNIRMVDQYNLHRNNGVSIFMIPFFAEKSEKYTDLLKLVAGFAVNETQPTVLITHVAINGVRNNDGSIVEGSLPPNLFQCFDSIIVGHYHNRQTIGHINYIGSTLQHNYGENEDKGVALLHQDLSITYVKVPNVTTYSTVRIEVDSTTNLKEIVDNINLHKKDKEFVRCVLKGSPEVMKSLDRTLLINNGIDYKEQIDITVDEVSSESVSPSMTMTQIKQYWSEFCEKNDLQHIEQTVQSTLDQLNN